MGFLSQLPQIRRFLSAGGVGVLLYYLILYFLTDVVGVWYLASAVTASVVNYVSNFILQKFWTFENRGTRNIHEQAGKYAIMVAALFMANLLLLYLLVEYARLWYLAAQVIVTVFLTVISYSVSRRIFAS